MLGKIFKFSIYLEKTSKPVVQKFIAKVSKVPEGVVQEYIYVKKFMDLPENLNSPQIITFRYDIAAIFILLEVGVAQ